MNKKKKLTLGIDLDDTITNSIESLLNYAKLYNKEKGISFPIDENQWDFDKAFGWNENNIIEFTSKYLKTLLKEATIKEGAVETIEKLREEGYEIVVITARYEKELGDPYNFTKAWLEENNIFFDKLIVNSKEKEIDCLKNNVEIFIDDNVNNCIKVHEKLHIPVFLFDNIFNRNKEQPFIERIYSWSELYSKIKNIS